MDLLHAAAAPLSAAGHFGGGGAGAGVPGAVLGSVPLLPLLQLASGSPSPGGLPLENIASLLHRACAARHLSAQYRRNMTSAQELTASPLALSLNPGAAELTRLKCEPARPNAK